MNYQVIFHCVTCFHYNKQHIGEPVEMRETDFDSFSEAWTHMLNNPKHHMSILVRDETEDD